MILELRVPPLRNGIDVLEVVAWFRHEGDPVEFGTVLVELAPRERIPRQAKDPAAINASLPMATAAGVAAFNGEHVRAVEERIQLIAADRGTLRSIVAAAGGDVMAGGVLALVTTDPGESLDGDRLPFRVATEFVDPDIERELGVR